MNLRIRKNISSKQSQILFLNTFKYWLRFIFLSVCVSACVEKPKDNATQPPDLVSKSNDSANKDIVTLPFSKLFLDQLLFHEKKFEVHNQQLLFEQRVIKIPESLELYKAYNFETENSLEKYFLKLIRINKTDIIFTLQNFERSNLCFEMNDTVCLVPMLRRSFPTKYGRQTVGYYYRKEFQNGIYEIDISGDDAYCVFFNHYFRSRTPFNNESK